MTRPELHRLETFLLVAEARTFAGAARIIGKTNGRIGATTAARYRGHDIGHRQNMPSPFESEYPDGAQLIPAVRTIERKIQYNTPAIPIAAGSVVTQAIAMLRTVLP